MLYYNRTDLSVKIDVAKINDNKKCMVCHYWSFKHGFKFQHSICSGCHTLTIFCLNISNIAIITINNVGYCCIIYGISKSEAIHLLKNSKLGDRRHI